MSIICSFTVYDNTFFKTIIIFKQLRRFQTKNKIGIFVPNIDGGCIFLVWKDAPRASESRREYKRPHYAFLQV